MSFSEIVWQLFAMLSTLLFMGLQELNEVTTSWGLYDYYDLVEVDPQFDDVVGTAAYPGMELVWRRQEGCGSKLMWSADSQTFAAMGSWHHCVYSVGDRSGVILKSQYGGHRYNPAFLIADGQTIYQTGLLPDGDRQRPVVSVLSVSDPKQTQIIDLNSSASYYFDIRLSPDETRFLVLETTSGGMPNTLQVYAYPSFELVHSVTLSTEAVTAMVLSPDSRHVVIGKGRESFMIIDYLSGQIVEEKLDYANKILDIIYSDDGQYLLVSGYRLGSQTRTDGVQDTVRLVSVADYESAFAIRRGTLVNSYSYTAAISPDNKWIAAACQDDRVFVRSVCVIKRETSEVVYRLRVKDIVVAVRFSPDGRYLAATAGSTFLWKWGAE